MEFILKELRKEYGYTQSYVANYIYVSKNSYAKYESGATEIPLDGLIKLAILYDTSTDYILNLTDEEFPYKRKK